MRLVVIEADQRGDSNDRVARQKRDCGYAGARSANARVKGSCDGCRRFCIDAFKRTRETEIEGWPSTDTQEWVVTVA